MLSSPSAHSNATGRRSRWQESSGARLRSRESSSHRVLKASNGAAVVQYRSVIQFYVDAETVKPIPSSRPLCAWVETGASARLSGCAVDQMQQPNRLTAQGAATLLGVEPAHVAPAFSQLQKKRRINAIRKRLAREPPAIAAYRRNAHTGLASLRPLARSGHRASGHAQ
jgi:hypothetical protein